MPLAGRSLVKIISALLPIVAACVPAAAPAQGTSAPAEVVVVGTVHGTTPRFSVDTLLGILDRVRPAVILVELDSSFFDDSLRLRPEYQAISLENAAVTRFSARTGTPLRPYDIEGRNRAYEQQDYFARQRRLSEAIGQLDRQGALVPEAKGRLRELDDLSAIRDAIGADRAVVINSAASDTAIRWKQEYGYAGLRRIIELSAGLADFADFWRWADEFWTRRNETMHANIVRIAALFRGRRVVVICGYEHRYYLRSLLRQDEATGRLKLREYWNY
jgi:hypothetical protein